MSKPEDIFIPLSGEAPGWVSRTPVPPVLGATHYIRHWGQWFIATINVLNCNGERCVSYLDRSYGIDRAFVALTGGHAYGDSGIYCSSRCDEEGNPYCEPLIPEPPHP